MRIGVQQHSYPAYEAHNTTTELARFLARSQLVTGGMNKFDDRPENYLSWKSTFLGTIEGLGLTVNEEIDLMIKWLGPESSEHARRIKAVNVYHPSQGLKMIWSRIEECYGSPEAMERALFSKIENFPKLSGKDHHKLRELGDVLLELEYAKQDGHLPGLSYLDTARGVGPIVDKLPFHLQEKWMTTGSRYKEQYKVSFPPFNFFADFVQREAKARNDPSFNTTHLSSSTAKEERYIGNSRRPPVSVHKTNISTEASTEVDNTVEDLSKQCPIHHKPHPLRKCRGFRVMLLDDRKKFLKDNSICFRCCASTTHQAKNCDMVVKCTECESERHLAALHPGPAPPFPKPFSPSKEHGGEQEAATSPDVTSRCTKVCGTGFSGKSCSKICLVNIYPDGQRQETKKIYAILDDQSNLSLAKTEFFEMFGIQGITTPYTLKTCAGTTETAGRRAYGYIIESVDGKTSIPLPTLIECNQVPNNRSEIPTPEAALNHSHLRSITDQIPRVDPDAQILLLLGRDILQVHKKLDLGWVIIGDVCLGSAHKPNEVSTLKTCVLGNGRPSYLTPCESLVRVKENYSMPTDDNSCGGWHICKKGLTEKELTQAEQIVIRCVQHEIYSEEMKCIQGKQDLPNNSPLCKLHPIMDSEGLLRVGGRISQSKLQEDEANPILIPGQHHIATLLIHHHHESVKHQGRHLTEGAIRASGLWIIGAKRSINSLIHRCVTCRKLRRKIEHQQMADLPAERLQTDPPFSYVGLDVFGPWEITTRRTRGGQARSKRWAVMFTCMCTRAVHIEVIESMSSSSFINALRRFFSIRGPAKQLRSDCGTNFVGASKELKLDPPSLGETSVEDYLLDKKCTWVFNPPHASHMGGAWERMIGIARRILESMFLQLGYSKLTHEVLTTLMAEVTAIINARPLVPVSSDPEAPLILTPSTLLTQKIGVSPPPPGDFTKGDMFKHQWKRVQVLADTFWARWRKEYLNTLQSRQKWHRKKPNLEVGDVVLMKDNQARRNEWPMGIILKALPSKDGLVRKVEIKVTRHQTTKTFSRPTSEVVLLLSSEDKDL
ncbi:hypothetical protein SKAU_G00139710 [Synaphobranchus kaupii]|uniref:Integrase catalytic domain-containing protein n=1 Tax=Synaphobranchus kaupii TaxID=118154 RepID=A0A9Q1FS06_SYNKA|nr:hypothetical protein SKAU_G00139710 [Synaphobranchus kaupii]